ncbi:MAG: uracil-DNA glycosylase [Novosphingobium sp.]|nr:uracil-DNA glycosylase [Novosphingobium sp.]
MLDAKAADKARSFVDRLASVRLPDVFNPYSDSCPYHDLPRAPSIRRRNLELVLAAALSAEAIELWIAQDLGRLGGRRTGLALTDEMRFPDLQAHWGISGIARATSGEAVGEPTAGYVWKALNSRPEKVFLWNVFPFQPHPEGSPLRNRGHTRKEASITRWTLDWILSELVPTRVVAIGRFAEGQLNDRGVANTVVRHPGRGGGPMFLKQILV